MTEQPKLIESVEEALEAEKQGRLILGNGEEWEISSMQLNEAVAMVKTTKELFWKPTEYEYVTMESFRLQEWIRGDYEFDKEATDCWQIFDNDAGSNYTPILIKRLIDGQRIRRKKVEDGGEIKVTEWRVSDTEIKIYLPDGTIPMDIPEKGEWFANRPARVIHEE